MAWGILEPRSRPAHVPATVQLRDDSHEIAASHQHLKVTTYQGKTIILVPQPSDDPNDPLNWSIWQRDAIFLLYTMCTILTIGGIGPVMSPIAFELTVLFNVSFTKISLLTGYSLLATACFGIVLAPAARKYGRRFPLIFSMSCAFAGCLWAGYAKSYNSILGARVVQGLCVCMFESLNFVIVGDLYYVHERGVRVAIITTAIAGLGNLPPLVSGKVASTLGWRWIFWLLSIFMGLALLLSVFFGFETAYNRKAIYNTDTASQDNLDRLEEKQAVRTGERDDEAAEIARTETLASERRSRKPYLARLNPWSGTYSKIPFWQLIIRPYMVLWNPVVVWAILLFAFPALWLVGFNLLIAQIFASPPYLLGTAELGYMSAGAVVGGVLGSLICGSVSDPLIKFLARRNGGVYEPEFRLFLVVLALVLTIVAYFPFGFMIRDGRSAVAISAMYGVATTAGQTCMTVVGSYIIDAYRDITVEVFVATMVLKNFLFFGFSYFINDWITRWGTVKFFCCVGAIQLVLCLLTLPIYVYGKKLRLWWHDSRVNA